MIPFRPAASSIAAEQAEKLLEFEHEARILLGPFEWGEQLFCCCCGSWCTDGHVEGKHHGNKVVWWKLGTTSKYTKCHWALWAMQKTVGRGQVDAVIYQFGQVCDQDPEMQDAYARALSVHRVAHPARAPPGMHGSGLLPAAEVPAQPHIRRWNAPLPAAQVPAFIAQPAPAGQITGDSLEAFSAHQQQLDILLALTATMQGQITELTGQTTTMQEQIAALTLRVTALEPAAVRSGSLDSWEIQDHQGGHGDDGHDGDGHVTEH